MGTRLTWKFDSGFICNVARDWLWVDGKPIEKSLELLRACLNSDQISDEDRDRIAIEILEGRKKLVGINECSVVVDGVNIRPISKLIETHERELAILRIAEDIRIHPTNYVDKFAATKPLDGFDSYDFTDLRCEAGFDSEIAYTSILTDLRLYLYSSDNSANMLREEYWDKSLPLDAGLYLLEKPDLVYDLIGGPIESEVDSSVLYSELFKYWKNRINSLPEDIAISVVVRNARYIREKERQTGEICKAPSNDDDLLFRTEPDTFLSAYGFIDRHGNWYSCPFGGHETKANLLILGQKEGFIYSDSVESNILYSRKAKDILYNSGWVILENPILGGLPFVTFSDKMRATSGQKNKLLDYVDYFKRYTLKGIEGVFVDARR